MSNSSFRDNAYNLFVYKLYITEFDISLIGVDVI